MIEECSDSVKKWVELLVVSENELYVDDYIKDALEDLNLENSNIDVLGQYYNIFASMSSVASRMRLATEKVLTEKFLDEEIKRLEEEE